MWLPQLRTPSPAPARVGITTVAVVLLASSVFADVPAQSYNPFSIAARCPFDCTEDRFAWAQYGSLDKIHNCNRTTLLDLNLYHEATAGGSSIPIRACVVKTGGGNQATTRRRPGDFNVEKQSVNMPVYIRSGSGSLSDLQAALQALAAQVGSEPEGSQTTLIAKQNDTVVGVYAGSQVEKTGLVGIIQSFGASVSARQAAAELCYAEGTRSTAKSVGIFSDSTGDLVAVQAALRAWHDAQCVGTASSWDSKATSLENISLDIITPTKNSTANRIFAEKRQAAVCKYTQVKAGDGCWALADRCGITQAQLASFNRPNFCNNPNPPITVGEYVCCSKGSLPDMTPQPNPDGTCKTTTIKTGDTCGAIATANQMTVKQIEDRNKKTWGWAGCGPNLLIGQRLCLSTGSPPMPNSVPNAVCGPQVPGTQKPPNMDDLADLNPCPLDVCCNVWGQCGITEDFCISAPADTGAPGTAKPGSNGCVASCGMGIVNNGSPPPTFRRIGYFEGWNAERPCLHMSPTQIDTNHYTHVHFAFPDLSSSFQVVMGDLQDSYDQFKTLTGVKRIVSFGGWGFSTEPATYMVFREGVKPANRQTFANNVVRFIVDQGLEGVDFDWEYPGAPDIPGIPAGGEQDGANYLEFLKLVRAGLPKDKELGIAAPASFWYLKAFPIKEIAEVVSYIVYMTYDLHGQWDYGNEWATDKCPAGNCLRSHVNSTETGRALSMVTRAGVPANKIIIGMGLYGRSFRMTTPGCWGPDCTFTGPGSGATPGPCTETGGYLSNFEIREILATNPSAKNFEDNAGGDILVYNDVQWVSWQTKAKYDARANFLKAFNFGGTSDWAIDLDRDYGPGDGSGGGDSGDGPVLVSPDIYDDANPAASCYPPCTFVFPPWTLPSPTTISVDPVTVSYLETWETILTVEGGGVVTTGASSVTSTVVTLPPITTTEIPVWEEYFTGDDDDDDDDEIIGLIVLTSSLRPPPVTLTRTPPDPGFPTITWTYSPGPYPTPVRTPTEEDPDPSPPPPGPPPPGYPPTITIKPGPPGPLCTSGCGSPCRQNCNPDDSGCFGICGCIGPLCPEGNCVGVGCGGGGGGGGDPSSCRTSTTASFCEVECTVRKFPTTTTTTCNAPDCTRTVTACSTSGSTTTTTTTMECPIIPVYTQPPGGQQAPIIGSGGDAGVVEEQGDPPTTTDTHVPLPTQTEPVTSALCHSSYNPNGRFESMEGSEMREVVNDMCESASELATSNSEGLIARGDRGLFAMMSWASDQSGCRPRQDVALGTSWVNCKNPIFGINDLCEYPNNDVPWMGGGYILNGDDGCIVYWLARDKLLADRVWSLAGGGAGDKALSIRVRSADQFRAIEDAIAQAGAKMPRISR